MPSKRAWTAFLATLFTIAGAEVFLSVTDADTEGLSEFLYRVGSPRPQAFRPCSDARRLYEAIPGSSGRAFRAHPLEKKYARPHFSINDLGFRGPPSSRRKPPGVVRLVFLGGSNTFGPSVSDEDTYPFRLQRKLDRAAPGRFEVWNGGLNAYTLSQEVAYAERVLADFEPDVIIFQLTNRGRRAFHQHDRDFAKLFRKNSELYPENIPPPWGWGSLGGLHDALVRRWRVYRWTVHRVNLVRWGRGGADPADLGTYGDRVSRRDLQAFLRAHPGLKTGFWGPRGEFDAHYAQFQQLRFVSLAADMASMPAEYKIMHPPSYVYEWYADRLMALLPAAGLIEL